MPLLQNFLQPALVIRFEKTSVPLGVPGANELGRRFVPAVEVYRPDEGLHRVGKQTLSCPSAGGFLADAEVQIRSDAYRLATIVEAYCSCATGLQMRLMLDPQSIALPRRQETMSNKITAAVERLRSVQGIRTGQFGGSSEFNAPMSADVEKYVQVVIDQCTIKSAKLRTMFRRGN